MKHTLFIAILILTYSCKENTKAVSKLDYWQHQKELYRDSMDMALDGKSYAYDKYYYYLGKHDEALENAVNWKSHPDGIFHLLPMIVCDSTTHEYAIQMDYGCYLSAKKGDLINMAEKRNFVLSVFDMSSPIGDEWIFPTFDSAYKIWHQVERIRINDIKLGIESSKQKHIIDSIENLRHKYKICTQ